MRPRSTEHINPIEERAATPTESAPLELCAIYTRASTSAERGQRPSSLAEQQEACFAWTRRERGWDMVPQRDDENATAGADRDHPALNQLLVDADNGGLDVVLAATELGGANVKEEVR